MRIFNNFKLLTIIVFVMSLGACDDNPNPPGGEGEEEVLSEASIGPDVEDSGFYSSKNNSARLDGDVFGSGKSDNESIRKVFDVTLTQPSEEFEIEKAYVTNRYTSSDTIYAIVPVRNISDVFLCGIEVKGIVYKDQNGNTLATGANDFIDGSVGLNTKGKMISTCLAPKEVGYMLGITSERDDSKLFSATSSVEITSIERSADTHKRLKEHVLPTEYVILGADRGRLEVSIENQGTQPLNISYGSPYILLDNSGLPLTWGFLTLIEKENAVLAPGEIELLYELIHDFEGAGSTIRPVINFEIPGSARAHSTKINRARLDPNSFSLVDEYHEYLHSQKQMENAKREKMRSE